MGAPAERAPATFLPEVVHQGDIDILVGPHNRDEFLQSTLESEGLGHITEDPSAAYCFISLTLTPTEVKPILAERQRVLMEKVLKPAGITAYDPQTAPYSPDLNLTSQPNEIYLVDSGKIAGARFFVGHNVIASTGQGVEAEKAKQFNRFAVILLDENIRVSRMQPHRAIYLQYSDLEKQAADFIEVFRFLQQFTPGLGFEKDVPVLLGFDAAGNAVNLEAAVYEKFPHLKYVYDGTKPIVQMTVKNPEVFELPE
jgi:hypothetical protein